MEFPITVESQEDFDTLVRSRLDREKTKQDDLQQQVDALTAEKQELATQNQELTQRAETAEQAVADREAADAHTQLVSSIATEFGVESSVLRGADEAELRSHAESLKQLLASQPVAPVVPNAGDAPKKQTETSPEREFLRELGLGDL